MVISHDLKAIVGNSVMMPCSSTSPSNVDLSWRDRNNKVLFDIKNSSEHLNYQDQRYKGRVSSFPTEYQNKNFSINLGNLTLEDTGTYECSVVFNSIITKTKTKLVVKEDEKNSSSS